MKTGNGVARIDKMINGTDTQDTKHAHQET